MEDTVTEIRSFHSLKELREKVNEGITQYKTLVEDYSQWLGSLLRDSLSNNAEWLKSMPNIKGKAKTEKKQKPKKEKGKKLENSQEWLPFKEILLCASEVGEAEILFEAIEEINKKIDKLEKVKTSIEDIEKAGLGKDIQYIVFIRDGTPERIALRHKKDARFAEKFKYAMDFSVARDTQEEALED